MQNARDGVTLTAAEIARAAAQGAQSARRGEHRAKVNGEDKGVEHLLEHAFWVRDAKPQTRLPYIVKGLCAKGHFVVLWGAPGSGKSFIVLEMACAVGAGLPWRGRRTKRGVVLYVCAESTRAFIENRIVALKQEWPAAAESDVLLVPLALDLLNENTGDVDRVIETAKLLTAQVGEVVLIVVDTLAVTMRGGSENEPRDMSQYVDNVKRIIADTGAAALVVHHCGKDEARGMRGHSALLGAIDAELAIEGAADKERILRTGKVRDGNAFSDLFAFSLRPVDLGIDQDGDPVRTCVVDGLDAAGTQRARQRSKGAGLGEHQKTVLQALEAVGGRIARIDLAHKLKNEGMPRQRVHQAMAALLERDARRPQRHRPAGGLPAVTVGRDLSGTSAVRPLKRGGNGRTLPPHMSAVRFAYKTDTADKADAHVSLRA
jgi:KaiC/GvpD/RAD55 family RecA-like ATPase